MKSETLERNSRKHIDDRIRPVIERRGSAINDPGRTTKKNYTERRNRSRKPVPGRSNRIETKKKKSWVS